MAMCQGHGAAPVARRHAAPLDLRRPVVVSALCDAAFPIVAAPDEDPAIVGGHRPVRVRCGAMCDPVPTQGMKPCRNVTRHDVVAQSVPVVVPPSENPPVDGDRHGAVAGACDLGDGSERFELDALRPHHVPDNHPCKLSLASQVLHVAMPQQVSVRAILADVVPPRVELPARGQGATMKATCNQLPQGDIVKVWPDAQLMRPDCCCPEAPHAHH
mmetsp:Transcript_15894/g.45920  ORF Transcript_15894/g.45920 Transcript_15894/m.45920 type:complete len:215 (-) Transcript_15894:1926-2570(-)